MAGFVASSLLGVVYFALPVTVLLVILKRFKKTLKIRQLRLIPIPWLVSLVLIFLGEITASPVIMAVATASFVLVTLCSSAILAACKTVNHLP